jgi:hypothetical protein
LLGGDWVHPSAFANITDQEDNDGGATIILRFRCAMALPFIIRPRVLLVGNDISLLYSREIVLGVGFAVHISARISEALKLLQDQRFDLVVILEPNDAWRRFAGFVAQQIPAPKLLVITASESDPSEWPNAAICHSKGLYDLMKACMEMFGMVSKTKSQGYSNRPIKKRVRVA